VALAYPSGLTDIIGFVGFGLVIVTQWLRHQKITQTTAA
jgi:hypothetical protein